MSESTWDNPRITAYVLGELPEQELADFEMELETNAELAAAVEEARCVTGQLESLYALEATATLDDQRREAIVVHQHADQQTASLPDQDVGSWKVPMLVLAMAASLLLLIGVGPWMNQQPITVGERNQVMSLGPEFQSADVARDDELDEEAFAAEEEVSVDDMLDQQSALESIVVQQQSQAGQQSAKAAPFVGDAATDMFSGAIQNPAAEQQDGKLGAGARARADLARSSSSAASAADASGKQPNVSLMFGGKEADEAQVESTPDRRKVVLRGTKQDLKRVEKVVTELEGLSESKPANPEQSKPALAAMPTPSPASRTSSASTSNPVSERSRSYAISPAGSPAPIAAPASPSPGSLPALPDLAAGAKAAQSQQLADPGMDLEYPADLAKNAAIGADGKKKLNEPTSEVDWFGAQPALSADGAAIVGRSIADASQIASRGAMAPDGVARDAKGNVALGREKLRQLQPPAEAPDFGLPIDDGRGPELAGDRFDPIIDNPFKRVSEHPLSTFSVDVDTASYSKTRDFLKRAGRLPRPDAVRIEELLNYFDYDYMPPPASGEHPFAARVAITSCPWKKEHRLARIALKGKTMDKGERPPCNLVFLLDTSGSMNAANKLPLVIDGMQMLLKELNEKDRVAIAVYAGSAGLVLESTPAKKSKKIRKALTQLSAGGSTNGGAGIALAYKTARENFIADGVNRVILCTDGDFNVGTTGTDALVRMVENEAKGGVFLSVLGFGMGNHNDAMLEKVSGRGNGNYAFIDNDKEARKVLVDQTSGTLVTIAKDVKLQIEFNPSQVSSYRLIGYENRVLAKEDFNDDTKDAGEIGAGHAVTALYEIVPADVESDTGRPEVDPLRYQDQLKPTEAANSDEVMTLKLRYKQPDDDTSTLVEFPVADDRGKFEDADDDVRFAAAVAGFGMQLRRSEYAGNWLLGDVLKVAEKAKGEDKYELRAEFVELVRIAKELMGHE